MRRFIRGISTSTKEDQHILNFIHKDVEIPDVQVKINRGLKVSSQQPLDDVIETTLDYAKVKHLDSEGGGLFDTLSKASGEIVRNATPKNKLDEILFKIFHFEPNPDPNAWFNVTRAKSLTLLCVRCAYIIGRAMIRTFVEGQLEKFAAQKIDNRFKNGRLYNWFREQVGRAYQLHPEYKPISAQEFAKTSLWDKYRSEWLDKSRPQVIRRMSLQTLYTIIYCLSLESALPFAYLYEIPVRIILSYMGIRLGIGSINNLVVDFEGSSLALGVTYTKLGYELVYPELICRREDGKLVRVDLPDVPKELYAITQEDINEIEKEGIKLKENNI